MSFGEAYKSAINAAYAIHGQAATYTPPGGSASDVRVIFDVEEDLQGGGDLSARHPTYRIQIRVDDLASPERGGTFNVDGTDYNVDGFDPISQWEWRIYGRA